MDVKKSVLTIIENLCKKKGIKWDDNLVDDLGLDSLNLVILLASIEEELKIELNESDMNPFDLITVADVCSLAEKYKGEML